MSDMPDRIWAGRELVTGHGTGQQVWNEGFEWKGGMWGEPYTRTDLVPQWISLEDRRPEDGERRYLVITTEGDVVFDVWNQHIQGKLRWDWMFLEHHVTHWQPIPELPS